MKKIFYIITLAVFTIACEKHETIYLDETAGTSLSFEDDKNEYMIPEAGQGEGNLRVGITSKSSSERVFDVIVNEESTTLGTSNYTISQLVIPANSYYGYININFSDDNLVLYRDYFISVEVVLPEGVNATKANAEKFTLKVLKFFPREKLQITFNFDGYANETTWKVIDEQDAVMVSGSGYSQGTPNAVKEFTILGDTCYKLIVEDSYGDGLSYPNNGDYTLKSLDNGTIYAQGGGNFGPMAEHEFCLD